MTLQRENIMKKDGILNAEINRIIGYLGHTDTLCICDCGLPIPENVEMVDLSLRIGTPSFKEVIAEISKHIEIEKITLAKEIVETNKEVLDLIKTLFPNIEIEFIAHEEFKSISSNCKAIIRTGEATPYANIILHSGVFF